MFGPVEGLVGPGGQAFDGVTLLVGGDADADGQAALDVEILLFDELAKLFGDLDGTVNGTENEEGELLAAPAAEVVLSPDVGAHEIADRSQDLVSRQMAVTVVDGLEIVKIEKDQRQGGCRPDCSF